MDAQLKVLVVAAEAVPFTKVGGLAEFAGALPKALRALGVDARLMIPRYSAGTRDDGLRLSRIGRSVPVPAGSGAEAAQVFGATVGDVPVYLIYNDQHFGNRERVYGFNDDPQRFLFFSRAAIEALHALDWVPDVVHSNDWHTAPIPTWLGHYGCLDPAYSEIASLLTIHDFSRQGEAGRLLLNYGCMQDLPHLSAECPGKVNWIAQGITHADVVNTTSPAYARAVLESGSGEIGALQGLLASKQDRFYGILSGIDTTTWNPASDVALTQTFDTESLALRAVNKTALQRELHLPAEAHVPLVGLVSRLDPAKGLDVFLAALDQQLASTDCQLVVLGSGDQNLAEEFQALQARHSRRVRAVVRFDDRLARRIFAGADIFTMPSRPEAVSVALMTAMHYGAVPVVHDVGGASDTVLDLDQHPSRGTGFTIANSDPAALGASLDRAFAVLGNRPQWSSLQRRCMTRDFSWQSSARAYLDLYRLALRSRAQ